MDVLFPRGTSAISLENRVPAYPRAPAAFPSEGCGSLQQAVDLSPCTGVQGVEGSAALTGLEFSIRVFAVVSAEITLAEETGMLSFLYLGSLSCSVETMPNFCQPCKNLGIRGEPDMGQRE